MSAEDKESAWSIVQLSTAVVLLMAALVYKYLTYNYGKWKKLGVPYDEPIPLFGNFANVMMGRMTLVDTIQSLYSRTEGHRYFGIYEGRHPQLVLRDPELVHGVMVRDFTHFVDRNANSVSFKHDKLFEHLVNLRGDRWKAIRAKLSPTFTASKLKSMLTDINECTKRLINNLNEQISNNSGIVNVSEASAQFTTDTIGCCAFGLNFNTLSDPNSEFQRIGRDALTPTFRSFILNFIRLLGLGHLLDLFRVRGMSRHTYDFFDNLLETAMEQHESDTNVRNDFVSILVRMKKEESQNKGAKQLFTDDIIAANAFVFFVAGFETTASLISYCLYELSMSPKIQNQLREYIKEIKDKNNGDLSYETLQKDMKYLDMIINETLRLHPPVPVINRTCTKKYTIPDSEIKFDIGEKLLLPIYSLHRDPKYYPNPEIFDPERFTDENQASRTHGTFLPFGDGPRICIGLRFALMEAKKGLAEIISKFEVSPCSYTQIPIKIKPRSILLTTNDPIRLSFKKIE